MRDITRDYISWLIDLFIKTTSVAIDSEKALAESLKIASWHASHASWEQDFIPLVAEEMIKRITATKSSNATKDTPEHSLTIFVDLFRTVTGTVLKRIARAAKNKMITLTTDDLIPGNVCDSESELRVREALASLSESDQQIVLLHQSGCSLAEIAGIENEHPKALSRRTKKIYEKISRYLKDTI